MDEFKTNLVFLLCTGLVGSLAICITSGDEPKIRVYPAAILFFVLASFVCFNGNPYSAYKKAREQEVHFSKIRSECKLQVIDEKNNKESWLCPDGIVRQIPG